MALAYNTIRFYYLQKIYFIYTIVICPCPAYPQLKFKFLKISPALNPNIFNPLSSQPTLLHFVFPSLGNCLLAILNLALSST